MSNKPTSFLCAALCFALLGAAPRAEAMLPEGPSCGKRADVGSAGLPVAKSAKGRGVTYDGMPFRNIEMEPYRFGPDGRYDTMRYEFRGGFDAQNASYVVACLHGLNAALSHAGALLNLMQMLGRRGEHIPAENLLSQVKGRVEGLYVEGIDLPGCGNNADPSVFDSLDATIDFYIAYLRDLRRRSNGQPLLVVVRSYSLGFALEALRRSPGLFDGIIGGGGVLPTHAGMDALHAFEISEFDGGKRAANEEVRRRTNVLYPQLGWMKEPDPFHGLETLLLWGEFDQYQTPASRAEYALLPVGRPHVRLVTVAGGEHGVLGPIKDRPDSTVRVAQEINDLIRRVGARVPR